MQAMKLSQYYRSTCSWRVRWALIYKEIPFQSLQVNLLDGEQISDHYLRENPAGLVPSIEIDGVNFAESVAILEWIEEVHPSPSLLPVDPISRLQVRQLVQLVASGIQPLQNLRVQRSISSEICEQREFAKKWIRSGFQAIETLLQRSCGTYCFKESLTLADICLIPQCYNALRFGLDLIEFPLISKIYQHCLQLDSYQESTPERHT